MSDIRLYLFQCGVQENLKHLITLNRGLNEPLTIPIPFYLITHPRGHVLVDGGNAAQVAEDPEGHWGRIARRYPPRMRPEEACVPQLERLGIALTDVRWIVQTHLHMDHTGALAAIGSFPNAEVLVTRSEWEFAHAPDPIMAGGYIREDFADGSVRWELLEDSEDGYDVYGDGVIRLWRSPGHSPGHQSLEISLPKSGSILLTADACYLQEQWEGRSLPAVATSLLDAVRSVRRLKRLADRAGSTVVFGHDLEQWGSLLKSPDYYD
jgi:N-acyl homoserine lactone hydrolase